MKKQLSALLLAWALVLSAAAPAAAAGEKLPAVGRTVHGFRVTGREKLELLDCPAVTLEHEKSGAAVYYIASGDPNRTFDITFHTPALDDRGLPHILEHIVLSGSEKYPSPNIFFPAAYQTYNTFLNAMTGETTTTFPASSLSEEQLMKLMDFYLDGVFHPLVRTEPRIFEREAWRYDLQSADAPITVTGTVYNEMKGALDIRRAADGNMQKILFPGGVIGSSAGGDPAAIPDLTYEELLDYHRTYYHPSNALVVLYGDLNLDRFLAALDGCFSAYDRREIPVPGGADIPVAAPARGRWDFPAAAGSETEKGAVAGYGFVADGADRAEIAGLRVLADILAGDGSPVREAVETALPGAGFTVSVNMNFPQTQVTFQADGVAEGEAGRFRAAVDRGLAALVRDGVDRERALGAIAAARFSLRAAAGSDRIGPGLAALTASRWAAEGRLDYLNFYAGALEDMEDAAGRGWFEALTERYLIGNPHSALAVTVPAAGLREEREAALARTLADKKAAMTGGAIADLVRHTADFAAWASREAPGELVKSLQAVAVRDLPEAAEGCPVTDEMVDGVRCLAAETPAAGLSYTALALSLDALSNEDLHWAALYADLVGRLGAGGCTAGETAARTARYLGGFSIAPAALPRDGARFAPVILAQWTGMDGDEKAGLKLAGELLFRTDVSDSAALGGAVAQLLQSWRSRLSADPAAVQHSRMMARIAPEKYAAYDEMTGLSYYAFLEEAAELLERDPGAVIGRLEAVRGALATRTGAVSLCAGSAGGMRARAGAIRAFWRALPENGAAPADRSALPLPGPSEAVAVDAAVQYNLIAAPLAAVGVERSGKLAVLAGLVSDRYLTPRMRHVAGAYGAAAAFDEDGLMLSTYRDPSLAEAYRVFGETGAAVSGLNLTQAEVDGYILSAYSAATRPRGALAGAARAMLDRLRGISAGDRAEGSLREMKAVTPADVKAIGAALTRLAETGARSTFGGAAAIEGNRALFADILCPGRAEAAPPARAAGIPA